MASYNITTCMQAVASHASIWTSCGWLQLYTSALTAYVGTRRGGGNLQLNSGADAVEEKRNTAGLAIGNKHSNEREGGEVVSPAWRITESESTFGCAFCDERDISSIHTADCDSRKYDREQRRYWYRTRALNSSRHEVKIIIGPAETHFCKLSDSEKREFGDSSKFCWSIDPHSILMFLLRIATCSELLLGLLHLLAYLLHTVMLQIL